MNLPTNAELEVRIKKGAGLYRPELAVLASKLQALYANAIGRGHRVRHRKIETYLLSYFPEEIVSRFESQQSNNIL